METLKAAVLILAALALASCSGGGSSDQGEIDFERNSQFSTVYLRVFFNLDDGTPLSVNTLDDATAAEDYDTPISGHKGRAYRFMKTERHGTSIVSATVRRSSRSCFLSAWSTPRFGNEEDRRWQGSATSLRRS